MSDKIDPTVAAIGSGVATYGKIRAVFGAVLGAIIIIAVIALGINRLDDKHTSSVNGSITSITTPPGCTSSTYKGVTTYSCPVTVSYTVNGTSYTISHTLDDSKAAVVGQQISVQYDPSNPSDGIVEYPPKSMAYIFFGAAALVLIIVVINTMLVFKSQSYATVYGGMGIAGGLIGRR